MPTASVTAVSVATGNETPAPRTSRAPLWLGGLAVLSLAAAGWLLLTPGNSQGHRSVAADGYSRSAIGHLGLLRLLRAAGEPVVQSRLSRGPGPCGLLVVAEPDQILASDDARLRSDVEFAAATLVVLPKRAGTVDVEQPDWLERVSLLSPKTVGERFEHVGRWAGVDEVPGVVRVPAVSRWRGPDGWPEPQFAAPVQLLLPHDDLEPVLACAEGVLLGRLGDLFVLADPDPLANHGLGRGDNANWVLAMLRHCKHDGAIVFDETLHGHRLDPSIWHIAGRYPFVLVTGHLLLVMALVAWMARGRFGPVLRQSPAIGAGKAFLIDNTASLLARAGSHGPSLRRYGRQRLRLVAESLGAPAGLGDDQCRAFVAARMAPADREALQRLLERGATELPAAAAVQAAATIRQLTEGLLHARS